MDLAHLAGEVCSLLGTAKSNLPSKLRFSSVGPFDVLVIVLAIVAGDEGIDSLIHQVHGVGDSESWGSTR